MGIGMEMRIRIFILRILLTTRFYDSGSLLGAARISMTEVLLLMAKKYLGGASPLQVTVLSPGNNEDASEEDIQGTEESQASRQL